jgi:Relaxase/Mobilisation nuclease domain
MIVGFSKHSKGGGSGPVQYLTSERNTDGTPRTPPPTVLEGDAQLVRRLIDSLPFVHKYTSGVLSFAPAEIITPEMERNIMHDFESVAFAGLQPDQRAILWVRHEHANHHELHFVTPRVELSTGKSLNIAPPGQESRKLFDTFRTMINARFGFSDPDDPRRARDVSLPNHIARLKADGARKGKKLQDDIREAITERVKREVAAGRITDRNDVARYLEAQGFIINRQGENYISVIDSPGSHPIRLKGVIYAEGVFDAVRANLARETTIHDVADPARAERMKERLQPMIAARAEYNRKRYGTTEQGGEPERGETLRMFLARNLGADALRPRRRHGYGYEQGIQR